MSGEERKLLKFAIQECFYRLGGNFKDSSHIELLAEDILKKYRKSSGSWSPGLEHLDDKKRS